MGTSRAQLSLEFILIAAAFLAVLGLIAPIAANAYARTKEEITVLRVRYALDRLISTADELCLFGGSSKRSIEITLTEVGELVARGHTLTLSRISRDSLCEFYDFNENFTSRAFLLSNEGGKIRIS